MYPNIPTNGIPPKHHQNPPPRKNDVHSGGNMVVNGNLREWNSDTQTRQPYPASGQSPQNPLIQNQVNYVKYPVALGPESTKVICPSCDRKVETNLKYKANKQTHLNAILMGMFLFFICGCCIPYCVDTCQNADHYCPNCDAYIGSYT